MAIPINLLTTNGAPPEITIRVIPNSLKPHGFEYEYGTNIKSEKEFKLLINDFNETMKKI